MSDFDNMEDVLHDFLMEATELLSGVDNKLVDLEHTPNDTALLNDIFRGFHTIKGGAGFLSATALVTLCHLTENLFDKLRKGEVQISHEVMDVILAATASVRDMFGYLENGTQPPPADQDLVDKLKAAAVGALTAAATASVPPAIASANSVSSATVSPAGGGPDWNKLFGALASGATAAKAAPATAAATFAPAVVAATPAAGVASQATNNPSGRRESDQPGRHAVAGRREPERPAPSQASARDMTIRVETSRLDQVLTLSGEIGLTKNRLTSLRADIVAGREDGDTLQALDQAVSQLDLLVSDLQNAVMKTRMQPIGRLFQKYPRIARDLARTLGKDVELELAGEETEIDKTMIEDLGDPIIHLIRNAVDHGVESTDDRRAAGKSEKSVVRLEARQEGDHILLIVSDDGRGMDPEKLRNKAIEKGVITPDEANALDERGSLNLIFAPGFSTKDIASDVSGRGVGMDVVKTNIQKLNGNIDIRSTPGNGTDIIISLPLTLAVLPVLLVDLSGQPFAVPMSIVREIMPIDPAHVREVGGRAALVVRDQVMPIYPLHYLLEWKAERIPEFGVLVQLAEQAFILGIDGFMGREDAVIKSLEEFRPKGIAGVTTMSNGSIVLILDIKELLSGLGSTRGVPRKFFYRDSFAAATV